MSEKFSLKWNDFHSNVSSSFSALRNEDYLHDVTLVTDDDQHVSAHKLVLSACSDYFKSIFKKTKHKNPHLCLDGINSKDILNVLDYVYNGEVHIFQEELDHFLTIAQKLRLQGLLSSDDEPAPESNDESFKETSKEEVFTEPIVSTQSQPLVRTTSHQSIGKISISNEELEKLDERINEQIERDPDGNFRCRMCGKTSSRKHTKVNMKHHVETHFEGLSFPCQMCPVVLRSRNSFAMHKSTKHKQL